VSRRRPQDVARSSRRTKGRVKTPRTQTRARARRGEGRPANGREIAPVTSIAPSPRRRVLFVALLSLLVIASLGAGARWLLEQPLFRVQHVKVEGLRHESLAQVLSVSGLGAHPSMLSVNVQQVRHRLERFAWIDTVKLEKHWPNTVVVVVRESKPVAVAFAQGHQLQYVDARGRDLGVAPIAINLPTLSYSSATKKWPYASAGRASAYVASRLPPAFASQVSVITEDQKGNVTLKMTTPVTFVLGPARNLHAKFVAIASVIAHSTLGPGDVVDVTVPEELAVTGPAPS